MTLDRPDFQRLLFRTAFCVMACDGELHPVEKDEIKSMSKSATYFQGIDLTDELQSLLNDFKERNVHIVTELFEILEKLSKNLEIVFLEYSMLVKTL